jgi:hypothetical protein
MTKSEMLFKLDTELSKIVDKLIDTNDTASLHLNKDTAYVLWVAVHLINNMNEVLCI